MNITIYFSQRVNLQNHQADGLNNVFQLCFCFFYLIWSVFTVLWLEFREIKNVVLFIAILSFVVQKEKLEK